MRISKNRGASLLKEANGGRAGGGVVEIDGTVDPRGGGKPSREGPHERAALTLSSKPRMDFSTWRGASDMRKCPTAGTSS